MISAWIARLFPDGRPLVYGSTLAGKRYATQWTVYGGTTPEGHHVFDFLLELDPVALGQGGSLLKQRSRLVTDGSLAPVSYRSDANGTRWAIDFSDGEAKIEMPDGSRQVVPRGGAAFAIDASIPGQSALMIAELSARGALDAAASLEVFSVNQFLSMPLRIDPAPDLAEASGRWIRTSHHEEILVDRGLMRRTRMPKQSAETALEDPGAPLPAWRAAPSLAVATPRYAPRPGAALRLEDIAFKSGNLDVGATISIPLGAGPFPAVLFVSGSGTHDRHGIAGEVDTGTHEIMDHLAEQGFLGLRYDTRGGGTTKLGEDALDQGFETVLADARAALATLRARPEAAGRPLYVIGHSRGATVAMVLAIEQPAVVRGSVLMACMGRRIDEVIADQLRQQGKRLGLDDAQIARQIAELAELVAVIREDRPWEPDKVPDYLFGAARSRVWFKEHLAYEPVDLIQRVPCPLLLCQGGKDFQVSPDRDAERLRAAARDAGVSCDYALFPLSDHLFKPTAKESTLDQYFEPGRHVEAAFLDRVTAWLRERVAADSRGQARSWP